MKKNLKKSSLLVVLLMVLVVSLYGCSGKNDVNKPTAPVSASPSTEATKLPEATKTPGVVQTPVVSNPASENPSVMKTITLEVVDNKGESKIYNIKSDAGSLYDALQTTEGLKLEGAVGDYGYYLNAVNGITADYDKDQAYWAFYVNGEYGQTSIDTQPIADGDSFKLVYEKAKSE